MKSVVVVITDHFRKVFTLLCGICFDVDIIFCLDKKISFVHGVVDYLVIEFLGADLYRLVAVRVLVSGHEYNEITSPAIPTPEILKQTVIVRPGHIR